MTRTAFCAAALALEFVVPAQSWRTELPPSAPWSAMVYDPLRDLLVLLGPTDASGPEPGFHWEFDGAEWSRRNTVAVPPPLPCLATYAPGWNRVVLVTDDFGTPPQVWTFDGTISQRIVTATTPLRRNRAAIAFDQHEQHLILFGGNSPAGLRNDTWEFDGTNWNVAGGPTPPPVRNGHVLAYDPLRHRTVLFGGRGRRSAVARARLRVRDERRRAAAARPRRVRWIDPTPGLGHLVLHGGGSASFGLLLPNASVFAGRPFGMQAFVVDPAAGAGVALTNAALATPY